MIKLSGLLDFVACIDISRNIQGAFGGKNRYNSQLIEIDELCHLPRPTVAVAEVSGTAAFP